VTTKVRTLEPLLDGTVHDLHRTIPGGRTLTLIPILDLSEGGR
jgi:hypothetical protein